MNNQNKLIDFEKLARALQTLQSDFTEARSESRERGETSAARPASEQPDLVINVTIYGR
jgi:hypothetical protein